MIPPPTALIDVSGGLITLARIEPDGLPNPLTITGENYRFVVDPSKLKEALQEVLGSVGMHLNCPIADVSLVLACRHGEAEMLLSAFRELAVNPDMIDRSRMLSNAVRAFEPSLKGRACVWSVDTAGCRALITDDDGYELHEPCDDLEAEALLSKTGAVGGRELLVTGREVSVSSEALRKTEELTRECLWQAIVATASVSAQDVYRDAVGLPAILVDGLAVGNDTDLPKGCRRILGPRDCAVARGFCWNPLLVYDADDDSLLARLDNGEHLLGRASSSGVSIAIDLGSDGMISRHHAHLRVTPGAVTITRLSEKHSVWVGDLELGLGESCTVSEGQPVLVGPRMLYYRRYQ
jgi:hypothetical protein